MEPNQEYPEIALDRNVEELLALYLKLKPSLLLKKSLSECFQQRLLKLEELKEIYLPQLGNVKFLSAAYFDDHHSFQRYQDIPERYFIKGCNNFYFLSHEWETIFDPDPSGKQFKRFKAYLAKSEIEDVPRTGYWYDFSCSPQRDTDGNRTPEEEIEFTSILKIMHILTTLSLVVVIYSENYLSRTWCCAEWIMATSISPVFDPAELPFPFGNLIKFSQLAILITYLKLNEDFAREFMEGQDLAVMAFINSALASVVATTTATYEDDKRFLQDVLHRHFWYHTRFIGLRTEFLMALRLFEKYPEDLIRSLFAQFLYYTRDPYLHWTQTASFAYETMIRSEPDPFNELTFHGRWIEVTSFSDPSALRDPQ